MKGVSDGGKVQAGGQQQPGVPARMMAKQMNIYYSNCAMVATSPRHISLFLVVMFLEAMKKASRR